MMFLIKYPDNTFYAGSDEHGFIDSKYKKYAYLFYSQQEAIDLAKKIDKTIESSCSVESVSAKDVDKNRSIAWTKR